MKKLLLAALAVALCIVTLTSSLAVAGTSDFGLSARLDGFQEIPSKLTNGHGTFKATIGSSSITYTLTYAGLSTSAIAAHIHFAQRGVNGGVFAFLCGGGGKPACPAAGGTVTGTIVAADILAISPDQGLDAGDFAGAVRALRSGNTYANVHSTRFPVGEIRGQIRVTDSEGD